MSSIYHVGLDVHKETISACLFCAATGHLVEAKLKNERSVLVKCVQKWQKLGELRICYESSGAGFVIKRWMDKVGVDCEVIASSSIPRAPGKRIKTDRLDAKNLAKMYGAGSLEVVHAPTVEEERVRSLVRLQESAVQDLVRTKNRILKYLGLLGIRYGNGENWTSKHKAWLGEVQLAEIEREVLDSLLGNLGYQEQEVEGLTARVAELSRLPEYAERVKRVTALRGIEVASAMVLVTEIGEIKRFGSASQLMSYFGLTPAERSSGEKETKLGITKAGNSRVRKILSRAAWHQIREVGANAAVWQRREGQPETVLVIAKKADARLHKKYWRVGMRKSGGVAGTAVAREMVGFVWALLRLEAA